MEFPEVALVKVLVRFPLKSIARFRSVSKEWKSLIDSDFFKDLYISFNSSSSVSWSIIQTRPHKLSLEIVSHHGCERWGLSQSLGSLVRFFVKTTIRTLLALACTDGLVLIYAEASDGSPMYYIGNPLLQEWVLIPLPRFLSMQDLESLRNSNKRFCDSGLVTKMQSGIVVSYKVVWLLSHDAKLDFMIYSSDTEMWETKNVNFSLNSMFWSTQDKSIALNGILHWLSNPNFDSSSIVAYDFYGDYDDNDDDDGCCVIHFPGSEIDEVTQEEKDECRRFRRTFTTSEESIVYFNEFYENENQKETRKLRVWKLVKYTDGPEAWQLIWEVSLVSLMELGISYFPVVMHPLNFEIIYLWSRNKKSLILFNLRTHVFSLQKETDDGKCMDGCILSFNGCNDYMEEVYRYYLPWYQGGPNKLLFSQYVLPRWLHRLPRLKPT